MNSVTNIFYAFTNMGGPGNVVPGAWFSIFRIISIFIIGKISLFEELLFIGVGNKNSRKISYNQGYGSYLIFNFLIEKKKCIY